MIPNNGSVCEEHITILLPNMSASLGVRLSPMNSVTDIQVGGRADMAGLKKHDRIVMINGTALVGPNGELAPAANVLKPTPGSDELLQRRLVVLRMKDPSDRNVVTVELARDANV